MLTDATPHYAAFISYAHADEAIAARLHKALETYPVPKHLRGEGRATRPIFRDVAELTAAHSLSEKIRDAVNNSRVLIVLCSPAAKASHWVNEEIKLFREIHGDGAILSAIIEGIPATSFPEALIQDGREPLAASLGGTKAGFRLGVTQLAAGILGTGLDELVQRGARRRSQRMGLGLAASLVFSAVMGFTAYQAVDARNEAELERGESEALLKYMVKDLKVKLEPKGSLDLLEGVGIKAIEYYEKKDIDTLSDDSLTTFAAARQVVAQVSLDAGRLEEAQSQIEASSDLTREVLTRNPDDTGAIYAHAQSKYWVGEYYLKQQKYTKVKTPWSEYGRLSKELYKSDPTDFKWIMEAAWGESNLALITRLTDSPKSSLTHYDSAIRLLREALNEEPRSAIALSELENTLSGKAYLKLNIGDYKSANSLINDNIRTLERLLEQDKDNSQYKFDIIRSRIDKNVHFLQKRDLSVVVEDLTLLFDFIKGDIDNEYWRDQLLKRLHLTLHDLSLKDILTVLNIYEELRMHKDLTEFHQQVFDITLARNNFLINGDKHSVVAVSEVIEFQKFNQMENEILYMYLMHVNFEIGRQAEASAFARKYLLMVLDGNSLLSPRAQLNTAYAYAILGECKSSETLNENLIYNGYEPVIGLC